MWHGAGVPRQWKLSELAGGVAGVGDHGDDVAVSLARIGVATGGKCCAKPCRSEEGGGCLTGVPPMLASLAKWACQGVGDSQPTPCLSGVAR